MCNCLNQVKEAFAKQFGTSVECIQIDEEMLLPINRTYFTVKCKKPGSKRTLTTYVLHSFCPVCGKYYEPSTEEISK